MKLTTNQYEALAPYEAYFKTAVNSNWARHPGQTALEAIHSVYTQVTKEPRRLNGSCQSCILNLLKDMGTIYLADKEEIINKKNDAVLVEEYKSIRKTSSRKKKANAV